MPTLLSLSGSTGTVNVIGLVTVPAGALGVRVDNTDTLD